MTGCLTNLGNEVYLTRIYILHSTRFTFTFLQMCKNVTSVSERRSVERHRLSKLMSGTDLFYLLKLVVSRCRFYGFCHREDVDPNGKIF